MMYRDKIYEVSSGVQDDYEVLCVTADLQQAMAKLAEACQNGGEWYVSELSVTVWADGVHSDEFFGMRITDNGAECHHYDDGNDVALWSVLKYGGPRIYRNMVVTEAVLKVPLEVGEVVTMDMIVAKADEKKPLGVVFL